MARSRYISTVAVHTKDKVYLVLLVLAIAGAGVVYVMGMAQLNSQKATYEESLKGNELQCESRIERKQEATLSSLVTAIGYAAGALNTPETLPSLHSMLDQLVRSPEIELLVVSNANGNITASTNRNLLGKSYLEAIAAQMPPPGDPIIEKTDTGWKALIPTGTKIEQTGAVGAIFAASAEKP